jgi:hypothetical protein
MTRQELVARALERLASPDEDMRFLAVRDLKNALEIKTGEYYNVPDNSVKLLIALVELCSGMKFSDDVLLDSIRANAWKYNGTQPATIYSTLLSHKTSGVIWDVRTDGLDFALKTIAESLVKAARYDAFVAKYQEMKGRVQAGKEEILQVEQFFKAVDDSHLLGN